MAHYPFADGVEFLTKLAEALGLGDRPVTKIVLVAAVDEVTRVYVAGLLGEDDVPATIGVIEAQAVKGVSVSDDCTVVVEPLSEK
jgi:hypothetical protein